MGSLGSYKKVQRYAAAGGIQIFCIPVESFPKHFTNIYLILTGDKIGVIDLGSGSGDSNAAFIRGLDEVCQKFCVKVSPKDIDFLLITHGHVDHFGGLSHFRSLSSAKIGIHKLDARQIINFEETILLAARNVKLFLKTVGLSPYTQKRLLNMYKASKDALVSQQIDFYLQEGEPIGEIFQIYHTPGHCPGQVCIRVEDTLFTGDHLLSHITPHQSPETISRYTGLGHYLSSLKKIREIPGIKKALGGHQKPMEAPYERIEAIERFHDRRLNKVLDICREPKNIREISSELFRTVSGYTVLLALEEAAAHVEYLYERCHLAIANLEELEQKTNPVLYYKKH
jgi:glyoxylase-like metal-dependent hydrolase (beta-lactamase superfamily II)